MMRANFYAAKQSTFVLLLIVLVACISLTVFFDLLESEFRNHSSFYLSESFAFTSFWWLFVPLMLGQFIFARTYRARTANISFALVAIIVHLLTYPALVWLISATMFQTAFSYWSTFEYGLTKYGLILFITYPALLVFYSFFGDRPAVEQIPSDTIDVPKQNDFVRSIVVTDGNRRAVIETKDILFFSASPPYIYIQHQAKRYLHNETLKSVSARLDGEVFVRIHKSSIVNILKVQSYKSRLNGDYDLTLTDGTELRLSRNYAAAFKSKFRKSHQDTTE